MNIKRLNLNSKYDYFTKTITIFSVVLTLLITSCSTTTMQPHNSDIGALTEQESDLSNIKYVSNTKQLNAAVKQLNAGDTLYLRDGIYLDVDMDVASSGTKNKAIKIIAEHGGKVKFSGLVAITLRGNYIKIAGFDLSGATLKKQELIQVYGDYNTIEDLYVNNMSNGTNIKHRYLKFEKGATHNVVNRCWFERKTQYGMMIFVDISPQEKGAFQTIENTYFKAERQPENGGSAIRLGTGLKTEDVPGHNIVRNNLFDRYDGENEIITIKSSHNLLEGNTFKDCYGMLTCRHYHNNTVQQNFFINTHEHTKPDGGTLMVWGKGHKILNNYFYNAKPRFSVAAAIMLSSGNGTQGQSHHEQAENILIKDNIIYETHTWGYALGVGSLYQRSADRVLLPKNIKIEGNVIYQSEDKDQIYHAKDNMENIHYADNLVFGKAGLAPLPQGISVDGEGKEHDANFQRDDYGIYRMKGKGPSGKPKIRSDVGPNWLR